MDATFEKLRRQINKAMNQTQELIKAENRLSDCLFIKEVIQGGKIRQSIYIHEIIISMDLYFELKETRIINHEALAVYKNAGGKRIWDPIAFFEFKSDRVIISFHNIMNREDFRTLIDRYLIVKAYGSYPVICNWSSRMNANDVKKKTDKDFLSYARTKDSVGNKRMTDYKIKKHIA